MYTKLKQAIEKWLRGIVADEVSKLADEVSTLDRDLSRERVALEVCGAKVNAAVDRLEALSHIGEAKALRDHIRELESKFVYVADTIKKLHPSLKV